MNRSRTCPLCLVEKPRDAFYVDRKRADALHTYCKECCKSRAKAIYATSDKAERARVHREWVRANQSHIRAYKTAWNLGIPIEEVQDLLSRGVCDVCQSTERLRIDHCHVSSRVRGVLCDSCNKGLGFFKDDPARLRAALRYLKQG